MESSAKPALDKQRADELAYEQLVKDDVPTVPIYSGLDGGMNKVFVAQYPDRVSWARVLPYASYLPHGLPPIAWADNYGSLPGKWFGKLFTPVACARANFMSSVMFGYGC